MPFNALAASRFLTSVRACASIVDEAREREDERADAMRVTTKLMMGGECVLVNGNMVGGVCSDAKGGNVMLRVGKERTNEALKMRGVIENTYFQGKVGWGGFVYVDVGALGLRDERASADALRALDEATMLAVELVSTLPEKDVGGTKKRAAAGVTPTGGAKRAKTAKPKAATKTKAKKRSYCSL
jgi:hypothetical protein